MLVQKCAPSFSAFQKNAASDSLGGFFLGLWLLLGLLVLHLGLGFFKLVRNSVSVFVSVFAFQVMSMFDFGDKNSIFRAEFSPKFSGPL